jgi:hypothetical protein
MRFDSIHQMMKTRSLPGAGLKNGTVRMMVLTGITLFSLHSLHAQSLVVNEIMASNRNTIQDEDGDAPDWIELYNGGAQAVDLSGYSLSDDTLNVRKWTVTEGSIPEGGYKMIFASDKDRRSDILHANFKLAASGETLLLSDPSGAVIDLVRIPASSTDISYGRTADGILPWIFQSPTPGSGNTGRPIEGTADPIVLSHTGGFYPSAFSLTLSAGDSRIFYTLDGSAPDTTDSEYTAPLAIGRTMVLKAFSVKPGHLPARPVTHTYFINESSELPVISLSADPDDLFDPASGIYTHFNEDWERPAHVEFFEDDKSPGFSEDCGINITGSQSANWAQKSIAVKFKEDYGVSGIEYPLFPGFRVNTFKSFVLRNSGNDWQYTHIRDALMQSLVKDLDVDYQEYRPAVAFINGEYWGIYNIREKISEHYVANRHGVDPGNIDMLENRRTVLHGDSLHYSRLIGYMSSQDMSKAAAYDTMDAMVDLDECILYYAAQAYYDNMDWPGTNIKYWRERSPAGKWRWILIDLDFGFGLYAHGAWEDHVQFMFSTVETRYSNPPWATFFQRKMVENPVIRNRFINQVADLLNTNFKSTVVVSAIEAMAGHISGEIGRHRQRWGLSGESTAKMITFAQDRPAYLRDHIRKYFRCGDDGRITVTSSEGGTVLLNTLRLQSADLPFTGIYFQGNAVHLKAIPRPGYRFDGWSGSVTSLTDTVSFTVGRTTSIRAAFSEDSGNSKSVVINEINYRSSDAFDAGDWIELYNPGNWSADLSGWVFMDSDSGHGFTFPAGMVLDAGRYLVLTEDREAFVSCFPDVRDFIGDMGFGLDASGEFIRLKDGEGHIVDSLTYDDQAPWPAEADGQGPTLELKDPGSDNGVAANWKASAGHGSPGRINSGVAGLDEKNGGSMPARFRLFQNYPNPFNQSTRIAFSIPVQSAVSLKVFDVSGREVATLVDQRLSAGYYSRTWDTAGLTSGVYFYRMKAESFSETRKLLLLR